MNAATKKFVRIHAPWLSQKYHAAENYLKSIKSYIGFAPNEHKKELRKELKRAEDELAQIERDIQEKIDSKFEDKEISDI
jgi:hypothetical protein